MEYILAIAFVETVMLEMKFKKEKEKLIERAKRL